ncbi:MAG: HD domain-containing phosphohydrolase [Dehalococcoidia bacterium]
MLSHSPIQAVKADFIDPALYEETELSGLPRLSRGALLTALSRAFDLAEGRQQGHAQRVAYIGVYLAGELGLEPGRIEEVFFASLLHDVGIAASPRPVSMPDPSRGSKVISGAGSAAEVLQSVPKGGWAEVIHSMKAHCEDGAAIARKLGFNEAVARAVASHHDCWDGSGTPGSLMGDNVPQPARIVAVADRVESMIDAEPSPLAVRRRVPALIAEMSGRELDPELGARMLEIAGRDDFWLGFYDNALPMHLMVLNYGGFMDARELAETAGAISDVIDSRTGRELGRGRRVADLAYRVAVACDMNDRRAELLRIAALLQDIGTLGIAPALLAKPDILTIDEMAAMQQHPIYARDILSEIPGMSAPAWWVGCHHERIDGKGYPAMLAGSEVPPEAQVIGMCEAYDALTSDRPYRRAMLPNDALDVMRGLSGSRFAPHLFTRFEGLIDPFQR